MTRKRFYVGYKHQLSAPGPGRFIALFSLATPPTAETHGAEYTCVTGPFRTKAGAMYMLDNPLCETVAEAERKAKEIAV